MGIQKVEVFEVDGVRFDTLNQAEKYEQLLKNIGKDKNNAFDGTSEITEEEVYMFFLTDHFRYYTLFEKFLFQEIASIWVSQRSEDFQVCTATGPDYDRSNQCSYSWYMKAINGKIPTNVYELISDGAFRKEGTIVIRRRVELWKSLKATSDIVKWCVENIRL